jgi:outer membrane immunogenic protein
MRISVTTNLLTGEEGLIMKRVAIALLAGVAAVAGLGYSASAADLRVAPAPAPVLPVWTGFYLGAHAGAAWQRGADWSFQDPNGVINTATLNQAGNTAMGGIGGFQAGYNWQFAPAWVAGFEADFSWASLSDHRTAQPLVFGGALTPNTAVQMSANTQWLASARAKLGFTGWWNTMFYATGGVAWADIEYAAQESNEPPTFATDFRSNIAFDAIKTGWVAGGGAEWMATTNILLRLEYLYYNLNNGNSRSAFLFPNPGAFPAAFNYNWSSYNVQVLRVAASYKF